jgi:hypothetical protein
MTECSKQLIYRSLFERGDFCTAFSRRICRLVSLCLSWTMNSSLDLFAESQSTPAAMQGFAAGSGSTGREGQTVAASTFPAAEPTAP